MHSQEASQNPVRTEKLPDFDITKPIDSQVSLKNFDGNAKLFIGALRDFEDELDARMAELATFVSASDEWSIEPIIDSLQKTAAKLGAGKLTYACFYMKQAFENKDAPDAIYYYPLVVEAVIEFKSYTRKCISSTQSPNSSKPQSVTQTPLADGFCLQFSIFSGIYFCVKDG